MMIEKLVAEMAPKTVFAITDFERRVSTIFGQITPQVMKKFNIWMPNILFFHSSWGIGLKIVKTCQLSRKQFPVLFLLLRITKVNQNINSTIEIRMSHKIIFR